MKNTGVNNTKVGIFVIAGILFMIFTLYMIGKNRNLLGKTFTIHATLANVNGLVAGNNVRFKGIDVGTVKSITVENDTSILVTMVIDEHMRHFLKKNAIASIGTDGLMGNKLININVRPGIADPVEPGDIIVSRVPVETDEMLRTLNTTNENIARITTNLYEISNKLNNNTSLWTLLADTIIAQDITVFLHNMKKAGTNAAELTQNAKVVSEQFRNGNGLANKLFTDTTLSVRLDSSLTRIQEASNHTSQIMLDLQQMVGHMKDGEGTAGLILSDTLLRRKLQKSVSNIEQGTDRFNQNMEALKHNFLFRRYFKKLEKEQRDTIQTPKN